VARRFGDENRKVGLAGHKLSEGTSGMAERTLLRLVGGLLVGGLVVTLIVTHEHPAGDDDNYPVIFAKYAKSNDWVAVHLIQFAGVLLVLGGFLVLYRVLQLRGVASVRRSLLGRWARRAGRGGPSRGHQRADRRPLPRRPRGRGARRTDCGGGEDRTLRARGQTDDRERVHGWSGAASMFSKQAALRSERIALVERKFVD